VMETDGKGHFLLSNLQVPITRPITLAAAHEEANLAGLPWMMGILDK
jgi:hypothetical protein